VVEAAVLVRSLQTALSERIVDYKALPATLMTLRDSLL
jgi:hypothetical protein